MTPADPELPDWLALLRVPGLGPARGARLIERFGTPAAVFAAGPVAWRKVGVPEDVLDGLAQPDRAGVESDLKWLAGERRGFLRFDESAYPERLTQIAQPPLGLFYRGDVKLLQRPQIAVVGARAASAQGIENAQAFAAELARRGLAVTSGLALGIDAAAHRGALAADGATLAVCGNGLDRIYPARNKELAHAIAERGLLLSEFAPGTPPLPEHFPRRNRILSGLSLGVLVIEAARESGSLITARLAAEQGREVFAVPGSIHNPLARGCHALIREGARLTESVDDVLEELAPLLAEFAFPALPATASAAVETAGADDFGRRVLAALGHETLALQQLVERLQAPVEKVSAALLTLELAGQVTAEPGDRFARLHRG